VKFFLSKNFKENLLGISLLNPPKFLDLCMNTKLRLYSIISFGWFPGVWILYAEASEHYLFHLHMWCQQLTSLMKMEQTEYFETSAYKSQTPGKYSKERIRLSE
jgi:hypothetical protein